MVRGVASVGLWLVAAACGYILICLGPVTFRTVEANQVQHRSLLSVAKLASLHHRTTGEWLSEGSMAEQSTLPNVHLTQGSRLPSDDDICPGFAGADSDAFILSTWRGEAFDCLAYPSGRHTFGVSIWDYLFGSIGVMAVALSAVLLGCLWAIRRLM